MATANSVDLGLSGSTGTGNFVGSTSPTLVTPTLGAATATSVAFSPTTGGIVGTTAADNASAGKVGEFISSQIVAGSAIGLTNATVTTVTSIALSAGDWEVSGCVGFVGNAATTVTEVLGWTTASSGGTVDNSLNQSYLPPSALTIGGNVINFTVVTQRYNSSSSQTIYLTVYATFAVNTLSACGYIAARRIR